MFLLAKTGGLQVGDIVFQLFFFLIILAVITGIVAMFNGFKERNRRLSRVEEKLDKLLADKEK
ncbi:hypothetical protein ACFO3D_14160 [Virgibacillus kekensis]|uniref:DUF4083 domain-containing protein n=1 Tax=Virgibacillus kekensis TaxID=202261 RepID=A0ABV9DKG0_9BACI